MIFFEDLAVGAETEFGSYEVTREEVLEFARKYDPQPFHLSDAAAAKTHFGRLAASGWHSCAMTMAVLARWSAEHGQAGLGSPGSDELRWRKPVYPLSGGDVTALGLAPGPEIGRLLAALEAWWEEGDFRAARRACLAELRRRVPAVVA